MKLLWDHAEAYESLETWWNNCTEIISLSMWGAPSWEQGFNVILAHITCFQSFHANYENQVNINVFAFHQSEKYS